MLSYMPYTNGYEIAMPVHENGSHDKVCDVTTAKDNHAVNATIACFVVKLVLFTS